MNNVIFITNIKDPDNESRSAPYKYGISSWEKWAKANGCTLFVLEDAVHGSGHMRPTWHKLLVFDILKKNNIKYDQVLIVDSDTIVHPECPNFFEMTDNKFCGVPAEGSFDWILRSIENYSKLLFNGYMFPFWRYLNSGFLIVNKSHESLYKDIFNFYSDNRKGITDIQNQLYSGTDQPIINFFLHLSGTDINFLPYEYNMQDLSRKEILNEDLVFTKIGWVYHYNAIPDNNNSEKTFYWMKKTYNYLYDHKL